MGIFPGPGETPGGGSIGPQGSFHGLILTSCGKPEEAVPEAQCTGRELVWLASASHVRPSMTKVAKEQASLGNRFGHGSGSQPASISSHLSAHSRCRREVFGSQSSPARTCGRTTLVRPGGAGLGSALS